MLLAAEFLADDSGIAQFATRDSVPLLGWHFGYLSCGSPQPNSSIWRAQETSGFCADRRRKTCRIPVASSHRLGPITLGTALAKVDVVCSHNHCMTVLLPFPGKLLLQTLFWDLQTPVIGPIAANSSRFVFLPGPESLILIIVTIAGLFSYLLCDCFSQLIFVGHGILGASCTIAVTVALFVPGSCRLPSSFFVPPNIPGSSHVMIAVVFCESTSLQGFPKGGGFCEGGKSQ